MGDISHALRITLFIGVPLLIFWNLIVIAIIVSQKIYLKRTKKFCESADTVQTTGVVKELITRSYGESDSPNYYASYLFYSENGEPFTGEYSIEHKTDYQEGASVTVFFDKNDPAKNTGSSDIEYTENLIRAYHKIIIYGSLFISGILLPVFLSQL